MSFTSKIAVPLLCSILAISCANEVDHRDSVQTSIGSGDVQGAMVRLAGTVTSIEDLDSKQKKIALSIGGEEVVALELDENTKLIEGESVQINARLVGKLLNEIRIFEAIKVFRPCLPKIKSGRESACQKFPAAKAPVSLSGVLHKIPTEDAKELLSLIADDKVIQLSDVKSLLADKAEGDELSVDGYYTTKLTKGTVHKTLRVTNLTGESNDAGTVKEVTGQVVKTKAKHLSFLTEDGVLIRLADGQSGLILGENSTATIKFVKQDFGSDLSGLLKEFVSKFSDLGVVIDKSLSLGQRFRVTVGEVQSISYSDCADACDTNKVAYVGYMFSRKEVANPKDILYVGPGKKIMLQHDEVVTDDKMLVAVSGVMNEDGVLVTDELTSFERIKNYSGKKPVNFGLTKAQLLGVRNK